MTAPRPVVLLGMMTKMPVAGVVWQTLHYLIGLRELGFDPYYVEAHARTPSMLMTRQDDDSSVNAAEFIADVMNRFDFRGRWAFHALHDDGRCLGLSRSRLRRLYREASLIINLHGGTEPLPEHYETGRLVYLETDPVQLQAELHRGVQETFEFLEPHCAFFTFAENYGRAGCGLPVTDHFEFMPTRQPVVLDFWNRGASRARSTYTTIGNWRQHWRSVHLDGEEYRWSKHHEFLKFLEVPRRTGCQFELALSSLENEDEALLAEHGFRVRRALDFSTDVDAYRRYVVSSRAEFTVAKDQNVRLRTGWFSDRSATYLAAGRPVITQDTGFGEVLPVGEGLFSFSTVEEVDAAVAEIEGRYRANRRAAFEIAREYFDASTVLRPLLERVGVSVSSRPLRRAATPVGSMPAPSASRTAVVIPCFDLGAFLEEAVASVRAQTLPAEELIVVDDGSTDRSTLRILDRLAADGVVVLRTPNRGAPAARNHGIEHAKADYVLCLDADDVLEPDFLAETVPRLDLEPAVGVVATHVEFFGERHGVWEPPDYTPSTLLWENCIPSASLFRKACWREAGGYADLAACQDWNLWLSMVERGWRWAVVPKVLYRYRVRSGSISDRGRAVRRQLLRKLIQLHPDTYRKNWPEVFADMDAEVARLRARLGELEREGKGKDEENLALKEAVAAATRPAEERRATVEPSWVVHMRHLVERVAPKGAAVLVAGDGELPSFRGLTATQFAETGTDAPAALETARGAGAAALVFPARQLAALESDATFRQYLDGRYYAMVREPGVGVVYDLRAALEPPTFSVVICTYRRSDRLGTALSSVLGQEYPADRFEVVVVDNEPSEAARRVVEAFRGSSPVPVAYHVESQRGLSHARNAGVARARCEYVAFLDDDATADPAWLASLAGVILQYGALVVGGRVEPVFEAGSPPNWMDDQYVKGFFGLDYHDWGKDDRTLRIRSPLYLGGGNSAYAKRLFRHFGGFRAELGRRGAGLLAGEETLLNLELDVHDVPIYYTADAVVRHAIPRERATKREIVRRAYWSGVSDAVLSRLFFEPEEVVEAVRQSRLRLRAALVAGGVTRNFGERCRAAHEAGFLRKAHQLALGERFGRRLARRDVTWTVDHVLAEAERLPNGPERELRRAAALRALGRTDDAEAASTQAAAHEPLRKPAARNGSRHLLRPQYERMVTDVRRLVDTTLPAGSKVVVVSKGDDNLVRLERHEGWHFPQDERGVYAGYYPGDSGEAIAAIERLRGKGAEYLVFPTTSMWWLEHYEGLSRYLESSFRVVRRGEPCAVFALGESASVRERVPA